MAFDPSVLVTETAQTATRITVPVKEAKITVWAGDAQAESSPDICQIDNLSEYDDQDKWVQTHYWRRMRTNIAVCTLAWARSVFT